MSKVGKGTTDKDCSDQDENGDSTPNGDEVNDDDERKSESPSQPLPLYQQRNNYYS